MAHDVGGAADLLVDHGDADAGADHDGLVADRVGRADRRDQAVGDRQQRRVVGAAAVMTANSSPPMRATRSSSRTRVGEPLRHRADQFVADRMAERVVDVLEVVEVDVEHGRRRAALAHVRDHRLQPLAEEDAVGQAAQRIVQRKVAQPRLAGGDGRGGAAHVAEHERGEQREAGERDRDERDDAVDDLGARPLRRPGEGRDLLALLVGQLEDVVAGRDRLDADLAQVAQLQMRRDLRQHVARRSASRSSRPAPCPRRCARRRRSVAIATAATMAGRPRKVCRRVTRWLLRRAGG